MSGGVGTSFTMQAIVHSISKSIQDFVCGSGNEACACVATYFHNDYDLENRIKSVHMAMLMEKDYVNVYFCLCA